MGIYINQSGIAKRMDGAGDGSLYAPVTSIATPENGSTASKAYAVGEMFIRDGKLCTCTVAIGAGGSFAKGTNYVEGSVGEVLSQLNSNLSNFNNHYSTQVGYKECGYYGVTNVTQSGYKINMYWATPGGDNAIKIELINPDGQSLGYKYLILDNSNLIH